MTFPSAGSDQKPKFLELLRKHAPYSVVDRGILLAKEGSVVESSRAGNRLTGVVKENDATYSVSVELQSDRVNDAQCTCCTTEEMSEQWCHHAVALLWRGFELEFFKTDSGFAATESVYRMNVTTPTDIAAVIREVGSQEPMTFPVPHFIPEVSIELDYSTDRLGVRVLFNDEPQAPKVFEGFGVTSDRALDSILLRLLDDSGSWDEEKFIWYVNSSTDIEIVLGLIQEYKDIRSYQSQDKLVIAHQPLDAQLCIEWRSSGAEVSMVWVYPDGKQLPRENEIFGTGPYWSVLNDTVYRLSPRAAKIASIFPHNSSMTLLRSQIGSILEVLNEGVTNLIVKNPELQPSTEVKSPLVSLELALRSSAQEHFATGNYIEILGSLDFEYPSPPQSENVVYLPDREKEREHGDALRALGFTYQPERKRFITEGDTALDVVKVGRACFPAPWKVIGVDQVQKEIRFAELSINLSLVASSDNGGRTGSTDWFDCHVSLIQNNANVPLSSLFKHARPESDRWVRLDSGAYAKVPGGGLGQLRTTLGMLDPNFRLSNSIKVKLSAAQALGLSAVDDDQFHVALDKNLKVLRQNLRDFQSITPVKVGKNFEGTLRPYQADGVSWLNFLNDFELGGILADEMGLGKTVQALALFQFLKDKKRLKHPIMIVAPTSVITNWSYEAKRFAPKLKVLTLHGPGRKRMLATVSEYDIVITSYALLRLDRFELAQHKFEYLVLDEAQNIKNPQTATTKAAKSIDARRRLALTGTPTENRPMELWSIIDFLMPGYLGSYEFFRTYIEKPILEGETGPQIASFLNSKTRPFILRRTKAEVEKDLPPKIEQVVHVEMTESQRELYMQILEDVRPKVFAAIEKKGVQGASISILAALLRLRQVCNHPQSISSMSDQFQYDSGKFNLLKELVVEAIEAGRKILLFSQFRDMLGLIKTWLKEIQVNHLYLDGMTKDRQSLIDQFNSDPEVRLFLISLKAGGTGLNLASADTVIIYDPWWNPAVESQAVDRAHRIGQTKTVNVYRLVTENSVEQKIMALKERKSRVVDALINENGLSTLKLSKADLEGLFAPPPIVET